METHTVAEFARDGFVAGPVVLAGPELHAARAAVDRILSGTSSGMSKLLLFRRERAADPESQVHVIGAWLAEDALRQLVFHPTIVELVCRLMGTDAVRLFRDQLFVKAPFSPGTVPWHQDYSDWMHTTPPEHITCWLALDDATPENGCLYYIPGTHTGPLLAKIKRGDDMGSAFERLPPAIRTNFAPVPMPVPAGGCVLHHCLTIHGSHGNQTPDQRRALAITYMHPETRCTSSERPVLPQGPLLAEGALLDGPLFPLLHA